uniref:Family with sequence similarity 110 member A n=1 Tax=Salarias fasciatus TaxID=181472 RepID=A0A672JG98_SALFA
MPVEALQHPQRKPARTAVVASPPRLRPKGPVGPDLYRQCLTAAAAAAAARPKQSAVERLEADKSKYVKSQVALSKQQPVRPAEVRKPPLNPAAALRPTRKTPAQVKAKQEGVQLDLKHLSSLISDVHDETPPSAEDSGAPEASSDPVRAEGPGPSGSPAAGTVRRVDVMPQAGPVRTACRPPPRFVRSRKRPSLTRSKSDMSDRYSRVGTDLERFFNLCGLDPSDLQDVSAPGSECAGSNREEEEEEEEEEDVGKARVPYGVSVIERNARVIKWLYGLRQAKDNAAKKCGTI